MKKILVLAMSLMLTMGLYAGKTASNNVAAFKGLVGRLLPNLASQIEGKQLPAAQNDYFQLSTENGKLVVAGNNANSMAVGLNYYLKYYCNTTVSWFKDDPFNEPKAIVALSEPIKIDARVKNRFFLNYCTFGYTMPWWSKADWEHFIDWMALNGVNLPLAITGQESIWLKVWTKLGLKEDEVRRYFTGPAHLAWHRMMNIDYWPAKESVIDAVPMSWLNDQEELQKFIVAREREFNMRPVLPAFAGHVPAALGKVYPKAKITKIAAWSDYSDEYACSYLDPEDPLYPKIQELFLKEEIKTYGTDHVYGLDLFNELEPPSYASSYLEKQGKFTYANLKKVDKKAVWLQMAWLFLNEWKDWGAKEKADGTVAQEGEDGEEGIRIKKYITSYPKDRSLLLDYWCEYSEIWQRTNKFHGVPYIWCYLGNFGGNTMLAGNLAEVNKRIENTFANGGDNFSGIGSTLEGFDCNTFMYEYVFEKAWNIKETQDVQEWIKHVADDRAGFADPNYEKAWKLAAEKVYVRCGGPGQCPLTNVRPAMDGKFKTHYNNHSIAYDNKDLLEIVELMLKTKSNTAFYNLDITNFTRQLLGNYAKPIYDAYVVAYKAKDIAAMKKQEKLMLDLLTDLDEVCATQNTFLMGKWVEDARAKGINDIEKVYYEQNARNLLTTWGEPGRVLNDYASRTWNGLCGTFYAERWKMFFAAVTKAVIEGKEFDENAENEYNENVVRFEETWWKQRIGEFPAKPVGNSKIVAMKMVKKYKPLILAVPSPEKKK